MVMCRQPAILAPFKGCVGPNSSRIDIKPGISASANLISLRPHAARLISATLYLRLKSMEEFAIVDIFFNLGYKCTNAGEYSISLCKFGRLTLNNSFKRIKSF